jgi:hypothetical protein
MFYFMAKCSLIDLSPVVKELPNDGDLRQKTVCPHHGKGGILG